jgi:hypothetical protein
MVPLAGVKERCGLRVSQKLGEGECLVFTRIFPFRFPQTFGKVSNLDRVSKDTTGRNFPCLILAA